MLGTQSWIWLEPWAHGDGCGSSKGSGAQGDTKDMETLVCGWVAHRRALASLPEAVSLVAVIPTPSLLAGAPWGWDWAA